MTLIELMVTMAIVGMIFAVGAVGLRSVLNVSLKKASSQIASTLRYLSSKAVVDHLYLRVVYDLQNQTYRVEESVEPFVISPEKEKEDKKKGKEEEKKEDFVAVESNVLKSLELPSGVFFKDVFVSYLEKKVEEGSAYTYFFPDGYSTPTLIHLRDEEDEENFSIELFAFSGRVQVTQEYQESLTEEEKP